MRKRDLQLKDFEMNKKILPLIIILLFLTSCRTSTVYNVDSVEFYNPESNLRKIERSIKIAGRSLNWRTRKLAPGKMIGKLNVRSHMAVVDIYYSLKFFSIIYRDSNRLNYNVRNNSIHLNYNRWIKNLEKAILTEIEFSL